MDPVSATLLAIGTAGGAASSAAAASQQNRNIERSMQSQVNAANTQQQQLVDQSALERIKNIRQAQQIQGRIRVSAGERGIAYSSGSIGALQRQGDYDASLNDAIIGRNLSNQIARVRSGAQANLTALASSQQSPILAGLMGGVQGLQTGLSIGAAVDNIGQLRQESTS